MKALIETIIRANNYMDSIFLMRASREMQQISGVRKAVAVMGTDMNKTVLEEFGVDAEMVAGTSPNDLILALDIQDKSVLKEAQSSLTALLTQKEPTAAVERTYQTLRHALRETPEANLAVISLPGQFAAAEARTALEHGMHVFIFSDGVPLADELELKRLGRAKDLLVMGPGAGTAIIDQIAIGLMSKVRPGRIGIVAASGSGLQEVAILIHQAGLGVSQAIGAGGRDLSGEVGGSTMLQGIRFLLADSATDVVVLISKPPHPDTAAKMFAAVENCGKPVVVFFLGGEPPQRAGIYATATLEEAAVVACRLAKGEEPARGDFVSDLKQELITLAAAEKSKLKPEQKYMRGLFCGGTHSEEAILLLAGFVPHLHSNIKIGQSVLLADRRQSRQNSLVDMGDEEFTKGRPHPVMDPSILNDRLLQEGADPEVGVILFDLLLGYGVHKDPVGTIEATLRTINRNAASAGRYISLIASVCGTDLDPQGCAEQKRRLTDLGVVVLPSNARAALLAGLIVS
ncbi:MAG: hypothetical protein LBS10_01165 [Gracilibacteraceae bacterium]|nr:hypothetical protein [Gracilibacteraceae bacterium]